MYIVDRRENKNKMKYQNYCTYDTFEEAHTFVLNQKYHHPYRIKHDGMIVWSENETALKGIYDKTGNCL